MGDEPVAFEAKRVDAAEGVLPVVVPEVAAKIIAEGRVAQGADRTETVVVQLGRVTNQDVLHAMS